MGISLNYPSTGSTTPERLLHLQSGSWLASRDLMTGGGSLCVDWWHEKGVLVCVRVAVAESWIEDYRKQQKFSSLGSQPWIQPQSRVRTVRTASPRTATAVLCATFIAGLMSEIFWNHLNLEIRFFPPLLSPQKVGLTWGQPFYILFCHILLLPHWCQQDAFLMALTGLILCVKTSPTLYSILPTQRRESQVLPPVSQPCQTLQRCFHHITHTTQTLVKQFTLSQWN